MEYFIIENNGQQAGPFSLEQLVQKAITPETLVWAQGMKDWTPAWKMQKEHQQMQPATTGQKQQTFRLQTSRVSSRHSRKLTSKAFSTVQQ